MSENNGYTDIREQTKDAFISWIKRHKKYDDILIIFFIIGLFSIDRVYLAWWQPLVLFVVGAVCATRMKKFFTLQTLKELTLKTDLHTKTRENIENSNVWKGFAPVAMTFFITNSLGSAIIGVLVFEWILGLLNNII